MFCDNIMAQRRYAISEYGKCMCNNNTNNVGIAGNAG